MRARTSRRRILVTNDDGIDSPGLRAVARELSEHHDVVVAAPSEDVSGAGTGIGRYDATDPTRLVQADFDGIEGFAVSGPPGLAVMAMALGAFGPKPDLVVSGINAGMNTGTSIIHSGTVGAALTARTFGFSGVALSLASGERWYWERAVRVARRVVAWMLDQSMVRTLNVNVPGVATSQLRGTRWAKIDDFGHFRVASANPAGGVLELEVHDHRPAADPAADTALCLAGYVTLTMLTPLGRSDGPTGMPDVVVDDARP